MIIISLAPIFFLFFLSLTLSIWLRNQNCSLMLILKGIRPRVGVEFLKELSKYVPLTLKVSLILLMAFCIVSRVSGRIYNG